MRATCRAHRLRRLFNRPVGFFLGGGRTSRESLPTTFNTRILLTLSEYRLMEKSVVSEETSPRVCRTARRHIAERPRRLIIGIGRFVRQVLLLLYCALNLLPGRPVVAEICPSAEGVHSDR